MRELINDPFYELIKKYDRCIIDYCLIEDDTPHQEYRSHKDAILFAMLKVIERYIDTQLREEAAYYGEVKDEPFPWNLDIGKAQGHQIDPATFSMCLRFCERIVSAEGSMIANCRIP
jgi:hypothetical protein